MTEASGGASASGGVSARCYRSAFPPANPGRTEATLGGAPTLEAHCEEATEFCDFADDACGRVAPDGVCKARAACRDDDGPVCGCDGGRYASSCAAQALGIDVDGQNLCHLEGQYLCGATPCTLDNEACSGHQTHSNGAIYAACVSLTDECRAALASGEDRFCECVTAGRCQCQILALSGGSAVFKLCGDR